MRSRILNASVKRGTPRQFNCRKIRISGVHQIGTEEAHKINYRANFTILHNLATTTALIKEAQRLDSMSAHIIDYTCDLLETKPPGISGNSVSDLLARSLVRTINPIKRTFTEVNKFRMLSTASKEFLNTVGIYCNKGKFSRTNLRSIMYDVSCEPEYPLCIVNVGESLNLLATPNKQSNPSVSNAFDIDLQTGSLVFLDSKILVDFELVLPSKGNEEDEHCLQLFFHKQNKKWEDDKLTASRGFTPTIMLAGSRKGISEIVHDNEDLTGSSNNLAAEDLGFIKVDDPLNGDDHGVESQDCEETTESQKSENTPSNVEFRFDKQFISRVLYEEAIMTAVKKDITKLLKLCHLESTGNLASTRTRLLDYVDYSLKEGSKIPDEIILFIVKSLNANGINMELTRLNLDTKGPLKSKKEALTKYLKCDKGNKNVETNPPSLQPKDDNTKVKKAEASKGVIKGKDTTETYSDDELNNKRKLAILESSLIAIQKDLEAQRTAFDLILRDENQKNTKNKRTCNYKCQEEVENLQKEFGNLKRDSIIPCSSREMQPQPITELDSGTRTNPIEDLR